MSDEVVVPAPVPAPAPAQPSSLVVYDQVSYDVVDGPKDDTPLVQVARSQILQTIEIDKLVRNLSRTDNLLHIASCGVAGFINPETGKSLQSQVMGLQYKLRVNTGEMSTALQGFGESAGNMIPILRGAFKDLYSLYENDCISRLARCEAVATQMAATSDGLKNTFAGLADEAQKIAEDTTQTRDLREKSRLAAIARQKEIEAQNAETEELKKSLEAQIPQVKGWYEEAKAAQSTAEGRVFALAIVGSITKALGDGLAAGLQFKTAPVTAGTQLATALASKAVKPGKKKDKTDPKTEKTSETLTAQAAYRVASDALKLAQEKYDAAQKKTKAAQAAFDKLEGPYKEAREAYEAAKKVKPKDEKAKKDEAAKKAKLEGLEGPYEKAEAALDKANEAEEAASTALEAAQEKEKTAKAAKKEADKGATAAGVAQGLTSAGASAQDAAASYSDIAANYAKEKTKYLDMMMDLQKQEREALGAIAKFAVQMKTQKDAEQLEQAAVESLHIAVGVLKSIVVILQDVTLFWTQMALACRQLADGELRTDIEIYRNRTREERIAEYSSPEFRLRMLLVAAQWHALRLVATEYRAATMKVHEELGVTYQQNPSIEQARVEAKALATKLDGEVQKEIQKVEAVETQIISAKKELAVPA